ncbi:hypothetical protein CCR75_006539 [Bremia lactucae]|uniref:FYVE-type domain-containing protein n=1 Tax=Bremia lactucae TaxID=4779 RepID=A0A976FFJ6_BRELC|nr:hypothetical protein CCR75_006539 [Bremia lactucae]
MPQPQALKRVVPRGNSAMAQFKPSRWQVENRCGICNVEFSLMTARHHCRYCGLSVCGKHSRNKVIVPTSLAKVPQRVCDKCYPTCRNIISGVVPPHRRDVPDDKVRRPALETTSERDYGKRMRIPGDREERRDMKTWNGKEGRDDPRRMGQRNEEPHTVNPARDRRIRSLQITSLQGAKSPHGTDSREEVSSGGKPSRERRAREGDLHPKDLFYDPRDDERRHRDPQRRDVREDPREKERRVQDPRERDKYRRNRDPRERDARERDPQERRLRPRDPRERHTREKELGLRDLRDDTRDRRLQDRERRYRERRGGALHERDLFDDSPRKTFSHDSPGRRERRKLASNEVARSRKPKPMQIPMPNAVKGLRGKRGETSLRTVSTNLSRRNGALGLNDDTKTQRRREEAEELQEKPNEFADSTFSIFSLAGSDLDDSEDKARKHAEAKKKSMRQPNKGTKVIKRKSMEKKEHLDFSASSSSVKSMDMSAITQKYLKPNPAAAMPTNNLQLTIEEGSDEEATKRELSRRKAAPQAYSQEKGRNAPSLSPDNKGRCEPSKGLSPSRHNISDSFQDSSKIGPEQNVSNASSPSTQNSVMSISEYNGFQDTQTFLNSDNSFSGDNDGIEDSTLLHAAANREKEKRRAKIRAKKEAIAGIDAASLEAVSKARTAATYSLTVRDKAMMRQISDLEAIVLQHQKELPDLLDMNSEAIKRSEKAQRGLQRAKVRVAQYEKAHAAVSRAIRNGKLFIQQKEYMAAILELSRATGIEPSNATLWYLMTECRLLVGQPVAAEKACMTCLQLQPTGVGVAMLGRILHERGRHDEAIACYLSALGRNDESEDE